eukprot:TRINITY_DN7861_c0_g1_i12.p1 TRINITY_DN7861_c0_g1~~TRINITY_DN7861_c0_g1_i12.p1  ORF type:complete len:650 (-),score=126.11 TRINITY_DN7861_c0_g1_i12:492-2441(-)
MNSYGLLELCEPVTFEPVGPVTAVFYDTKNRQVFSVRSGGATGIVVKSPNKQQKSFVLEDKGPILSIKFCPNQQILSVQRNPSTLDLHNFDAGGQIDAAEYTLVPKNKTSPIHSYMWTGPTELVTVTDIGLDVYSVVPGKKLVKYLRSSNTSVSWANVCPDNCIVVTSSKQETNSLQVWSIRNGTIVKLPTIETGSGHLVKEKEVSVINVYSRTFICISAKSDTEEETETVKGLKLYSTENDQIALAHCLNFEHPVSGAMGIQTLDNLILVHSLQASSTLIFDIAVTGVRNQKEGSLYYDHNPVLGKTSLANFGAKNVGAEFGGNSVDYSPTWVVFLPNIIVDARNGQLFTVGMKLKRAVSGNSGTLCNFLLHRHSGKQHVLTHLKSCLADPGVSLQQFSMMFQEIMRAYCSHQNSGEQTPIYTGMVGCYGKLETGLPAIQCAVVIDQSELYTAVLVPAEQNGVQLKRIQAVVVELLLALAIYKLKPRQFILEMFINLAVKTEQYYQMHQYIQYGVVTDSKHLACIILSLENVYPPARQIALDMMSRLGDAAEELIEVCLAQGKVVEALNLARETGLADTISARKYLEASRNLEPLVYFNVFSFFEERNVRLRGTPNFAQEDNCHEFVNIFKTLYLCENGAVTIGSGVQ